VAVGSGQWRPCCGSIGAVAELARQDGAAIEVRGLSKSYGDVEAVRGIDLTVERGQIFALLGPNGAGKTTTVEILEGYRSRDGGTVKVLGYDPGRQRQRLKSQIGIVLQSTGVDRYLSVAETVAMYAGFYPHPRPVDEVIDLVGLAAKRDTRVLKLSGGQQRRLDVAIALAGNPDLLFLDEPTTGFDPSARHEAWEVVKNLAALGKTVLLTTHYMDEAQYLADQVAVISGGRIVAEGGATPPADLSAPPGPDGLIELAPDDLTAALHRLTGWALEQHVELNGLEVIRPSLEDVYLQLTGGSAAQASTAPATAAPAGGKGRRRS
jgi:ABC-2 type transport system ATP-binding protein